MQHNDWGAYDKFLDELCIPVDGSTQQLNTLHRGSDYNLEASCRTLMLLKKARPFHLLVSTVLTKYNKDDLANILDILLGLGIRRWKVNRFCSTGDGAQWADLFAISDAEFDEAAKTLAAQIPIRNGDVEVVLKDSNESVMLSSVNISPDGGLMLFKGGIFSRVGSVWEPDDIRPLLLEHGFRHDIHGVRSFRNQYAFGKMGAAIGGWETRIAEGDGLVVCGGIKQ